MQCLSGFQGAVYWRWKKNILNTVHRCVVWVMHGSHFVVENSHISSWQSGRENCYKIAYASKDWQIDVLNAIESLISL